MIATVHDGKDNLTLDEGPARYYISTMVEPRIIEAMAADSPPSEVTEALATAFKALGDPTRLRILAVLADGTHCVCEIQEVVDVPGNLLSHHLKVLREAGLIEGAKRGRWIDYTLNAATIALLTQALPPDPLRLGLDLSGCADACARNQAEA